ncbi:MAG: carboxypeptidase-like regulatory domain-containing protein [Chitinophagales bacterium]|nr:carboxypeptidase-like regulatory domain-containing protein [Chitinophagales bacterium]
MKSQILIFLLTFCTGWVLGQTKDEQVKVVEFSGKVVYEDQNGDPAPLPYTNVVVVGTNRGTYTDFDGFFTLVALPGELVEFSRIGYQTVEIKIPENLITDRYTWVQIMTENEYILPEAIIMPWPSKEHFKHEFLAIDISNELRDRAMANLAEERMRELRDHMPADGREASAMVIREQARNYIYTGQTKPMNIFNPIAWKNFVEAWRRGDFKRKK